MDIIEKLKNLDIQDSMKETVSLMLEAVETLENGPAEELVGAIKAKADEIEDYYWRPLPSVEFYERFSRVLKHMGDEEAEKFAARVGMINSADLELKAYIQNFIGNNTRAAELYRKALEEWPENETARKGLEKAEKRIEKARLGIMRLSGKPDLKNRLKYIRALMDLGRIDEAEKVVNELMERARDPEVLLMKALILEAREKWEEARDILEGLRDENPTSTKIRRAINYANYHIQDAEYDENEM